MAATTVENAPLGGDVLTEAEQIELVGVMAEFHDVDTVMTACRKLRDDGYTHWDTHTPFPIHGMDRAMAIRPTILPWIVLAAGLFGMSGGILMMWYMNTFDYPYFISGKANWSFPAHIPVVFECTVLCAAHTAWISMLLLNGLPKLYNPLFKSERFKRVTDDKFFIVIDADDPKFEEEKTTARLKELGADYIEKIED